MVMRRAMGAGNNTLAPIAQALAAVTPIAIKVMRQRTAFPNVRTSRKKPWTVPPASDATAADPKKRACSRRWTR